MNLHYHEFLETLPDSDFLKIAEDWILNNSSARRGYWVDSWNAYSVSIRVVVWMQQIVRRNLVADPVVKRLIVPSLVAQMRFLENNLETDIGGNHLIKNIKAFFWAGAFFRGREAQRFVRKGLKLLDAELVQILGDGTHFERSPSYHAQVFADLMEIRHAHGEDPLGGRLDSTLEAMCRALRYMTHPDGGPALFNDAGLHMAYSAAECLEIFGKVLGREVPGPPGAGMFELPDAGYFGFRSSGPCLIADCGPIAPDDLPAHGHGDILSFELSWGGHRFVVDQGVFEYNPGLRREASKTAASHNTLCIEGADQADFFGSFRMGRRPLAVVLEARGDESSFLLRGSHDGFASLPGSPRHMRTFEANSNRLRIEDRLENPRSCNASIRFLLHPSVTVAKQGNDLVLARDDVRLRLTSDRELEIEDAVWWSDMGVETATRRLTAVLAGGQSVASFEIAACDG